MLNNWTFFPRSLLSSRHTSPRHSSPH